MHVTQYKLHMYPHVNMHVRMITYAIYNGSERKYTGISGVQSRGSGGIWDAISWSAFSLGLSEKILPKNILNMNPKYFTNRRPSEIRIEVEI